MKFIACGDIHFTDKTPRNRRDNYVEAQLQKFEFILKSTKKNKDNTLVIAGDMFDHPIISYETLSKIAELIDKYKTTILAVPGQHDLRYHNKSIDNTPMGFLNTIGYIRILHPNDNNFVGLGWEETLETESGNVLLVHRMVVENEALFPGQLDFITGKDLLKKYKGFKIIISGDNHNPFIVTNKQLLINVGSMMRSNKKQIEYKPSIWEVDTDTLKYKRIYIPVKESSEAFDFAKIHLEETKKENKLDMDKLLQVFDTKNSTPNFSENLKMVIKKNKPNKKVKEIINNLMEEIV